MPSPNSESPYHPPAHLIEVVPRSTPYDPTVGQRVGDRLEQVEGPDELRYTGFLRPPDAWREPAGPITPQRTIEYPDWWDIPGRAARYLRVAHYAGETVFGETLAALQASGSTKDYKRTSMPGTHKVSEDVASAPRNPTALSGDGAYNAMFFLPAKHSEPIPDAPVTRAQRRAVSKLEQTRRDAAIASGEISALKASRSKTSSIESKGLPMSRHEHHLEREIRKQTRRMHRKMRKGARIADGKHFAGRVARAAAFLDRSNR